MTLGEGVKKQTAIFISLASLFVIVAFQNCGKVGRSQLDSSSLSKLSIPSQAVEKQMIVRMSSSDGHAQMRTWAVQHGLVNLNENDPASLSKWDENNMSVWQWDANFTTEEMMSELRADQIASMMEYVEPNYLYQESATAKELSELTTANMTFSSASFNSMLIDLKANLSPLASNTPRPIVAVIDSGVDITHLAFSGADAIWKNPGENGLDATGADKRNNGIDDDNNGYVDDYAGYNFRDKNNNVADSTGHGTHCAGIVLNTNQDVFNTAANDTNDPARKSKVVIMPLKFIGVDGGATSDAINAIFYAANNGARILSNSWGGPSYSRALEDAIAYSYDREIVFVAAAGNSSTNNDASPVYPANYKLPNVISVAATTGQDVLAGYSNFGAGSVDVGAPGSGIYSTYPRPAGSINSDYYAQLSGTSMATPVVAGLAALSIYENRLLKAHQVKQIILDSVDPLDSLKDKLSTPGRVNPMATIAVARVTAPANSKPVIADRSPASSSDSGGGGGHGGCGLVAASGGQLPPSSGGPQGPLIALLILPLALAVTLRRRQTIYS